jgi:hypothetical protein
METIFKEGDRVFHYHYGWGTIKSISNSDRERYPVPVNFDTSDSTWFTCDGRELDCEKPTLSFTEYKLEGFSQERPEPLPKKGQIVWVRDWEGQSWFIAHYVQKSKDGYYVTHRDPLSIHLNGSTYRYLTTKNPYANEQ